MDVSPDAVIETFEAATEENRLSSTRHGQVTTLPDTGEVWMTGDLHDHRANFRKLVAAADLGNNPDRHLILHELIHGEHVDATGAEHSWWMLWQAAELKCDFPEQVHFLFANHDLAQIHGEGIMKAGQSVCEAFNKGVKADFGDKRGMAQVAMTEFLLSLPLAVRCPNGLFFCHSLPSGEQIDGFDYDVFEREELTSSDYTRRTGPVYQLIWGRNQPPEAAAAFADRVEAGIVVTGHQPQDTGHGVNGERHLILASDHNQGVFLPLKLDETYTMKQLVGRLKKFIAVEAW
ncbi:MAG: metallophosphoesterase [Phycisphaerae bacterium]